MSSEKWFSAKIRFAIMVEPSGADTLNECVFLVRAKDFDDAFEKFVSLGSAREEGYLNYDGNQVIWKFVEIISLDMIRSDDLNGAEVYSEPVHIKSDEMISFNRAFNPRASKPIQTI